MKTKLRSTIININTMNFFSKNRFIFWILIFLVIINLTALITFLVLYTHKPAMSDQQQCKNTGMAFQEELSLSAGQAEKVEVIMSEYRKSTGPLTDSIRNYRTLLLEELAKTSPDSNLLDSYTDEISLLQKQMQKASIRQYLSLKGISNPDQCKRLSALYYELYGCQGNCKGMGNGKGMMKQYRRGQGR